MFGSAVEKINKRYVPIIYLQFCRGKYSEAEQNLVSNVCWKI